MQYEIPNKKLLDKGYFCIRPRKTNVGLNGRWRVEEKTFLERFYNNSFMFIKTSDGYKIYEKERFTGQKFIKLKDFISSEIVKQKNDTIDLLEGKIFDYPKPVDLILYLLKSLNDDNCIVLDFFSGSATIAHAVMQLNAEDRGSRKFICVQLPETTDEKSEAYKSNYKHITEIGKERIRRAGQKIAEANCLTAPNLDIGFRVLKLDSTNMKPVFYNPEDPIFTQEFLSTLESNIKEDRTAEDLLFQVMLDMGIDLSSDIVVEVVANKKIFTVGGDNLICCFDSNITKEVVTAIANKKPLFAVFRDSSFKDDSTMVSFEQIFETYSPTTERRVF